MSNFRLNFNAAWHNASDSGFRNFCDMFSASVVNNFVHLQTASDYGYHSFGELARFTYCLLQKIKQETSLPPVEQWELKTSPYCRWRISVWDAGVGSSQKDWEFVFEERLPTRRP